MLYSTVNTMSYFFKVIVMFKRSPALYVEINFYQYPSSRAVNEQEFYDICSYFRYSVKELNELVLSKPETLDTDTVIRNNFKILIFLFATSR